MNYQSGINTIKKTLTAGEMASGSTPITIIGAPGSGLTILPIAIYFKNNVSVTWTSDSVSSEFDIGTAISVAFDPAKIFTSTAAGTSYYVTLDTTASGTASPNSALTLLLGGTAATGGTGTIDVVVIYKVMPL